MNGYTHTNGNAQASTSAAVSSDIEVPVGPTNQPRVLLRNLTKDEAVFHLGGVELAYANSLRRVMMADVPTVGLSSELHTPDQGAERRSVKAIDQVLFLQNTTPIPDEMLAHRLGQVPLVSRNVSRGLRFTRVSSSSVQLRRLD